MTWVASGVGNRGPWLTPKIPCPPLLWTGSEKSGVLLGLVLAGLVLVSLVIHNVEFGQKETDWAS